jgi:hypothetical protein
MVSRRSLRCYIAGSSPVARILPNQFCRKEAQKSQKSILISCAFGVFLRPTPLVCDSTAL